MGLNPQPLSTSVSRGAGSTTELSPTPVVVVFVIGISSSCLFPCRKIAQDKKS